MKKFTNYEETKTFMAATKLPAGGYVCRIIDAAVKTYENENGVYQKLELCFDISEGDYEGFYADNYRKQYYAEKSWKGVYRLGVPTDDNSEASEFCKRLFKTVIKSVESSNAGYSWDWNEASLIGKTVGIVFRSEEWTVSDRRGWRTAPYMFMPADNIRTGDFSIPRPKPLTSEYCA